MTNVVLQSVLNDETLQNMNKKELVEVVTNLRGMISQRDLIRSIASDPENPVTVGEIKEKVMELTGKEIKYDSVIYGLQKEEGVFITSSERSTGEKKERVFELLSENDRLRESGETEGILTIKQIAEEVGGHYSYVTGLNSQYKALKAASNS